MPSSYIYKAQGQSGKFGVFLTPQEDQRSTPYAVLSSGKRIEGKYLNTNEGRNQYLFGKDILGQQGVKIEYGGKTINLEDSNKSYEGNDPYDGWAYRNKGDLGSAGGGGGDYPREFTPGNFDGKGFYPAYLGGQFPSPFLTTTAPFKFTDPIKFGQEYGAANREEMIKNFNLAKEFSLDTLDTELQGLQGYVPGASALKRRETAIDNVFNQMQREQQVEQGLPGARKTLEGQAGRAETYAQGRVPDSITDRMLELTGRSNAADRASQAGFGQKSAAARNVSDIMSAEQRIKLSQYGDQLVSSNLKQKADLFLAPTSYSDAGQQVRVTPEVGAGRMQAQQFSELNRGTILDPGQAFTGTINQEQFATNLEQQTRQLNAGVQNQFALTKFQYDVGYAGAVAGAGQTAANTQIAIDQQKRAEEIFKDYLEKAQTAGTIKDIFSGLASLPGIISGISGAIDSLFGKRKGGDSTPGTGEYQPGRPGEGERKSPRSPVEDPSLDFGDDDTGSDVDPDPTGTGSNPEGDPEPPPQPPDDYDPDSEDAGVESAINDRSFQAQARSFTSETGKSLPSDKGDRASLAVSSASVLRNAGLSQQQMPGFQSVGVDGAGKQVFGNSQLMKSNDTKAGARLTDSAAGILSPLGLFDHGDKEGLEKIGAIAGDVGFIASLTDKVARKDVNGFITTITNKFGGKIAGAITDDPQDQAGIKGAFTAFSLFSNWDRMSGAQKSLGLATLGIQGYRFATGDNLATKIIPGTQITGTPGISVGQALGLFKAGYNVYSLVNNWGQLNNLQKIAGGTQTVAAIAQTAKSFGLLGTGTTGAAVNVAAQQLATSGFTSAPAYGIGALAGPAGSAVPTGYTVVSSGAEGVVAVPAATAESSAISQAGSLLGTAAGVAGVALGAQAVYKNWGAGGKQGAINGALGGTAMAAGLYGMSSGLGVAAMANPYVLAAVVAVSALGGLAKTGKHEDQVARDGVRSAFQKNGLIDKDYNVTLADGTKVDVGVDGHGNERGWTNSDKRVGDQKSQSKLRAYEVDYTNDLDYSASMMGNTLAKLMGGSKARPIGQIGGQLGNAGLGNIGHGKEFSQGNFNKLSANMRAMFAKSGIKSKADAYALANQGFGEGRWNESDTITMHQAINMAFDQNGYGTAQKLMDGRWRGLEVASKDPTGDSNRIVPAQKQPDLSNQRRPSTPNPINGGGRTPGFNPKSAPIRVARGRRDSESMKARNLERYAARY